MSIEKIPFNPDDGVEPIVNKFRVSMEEYGFSKELIEEVCQELKEKIEAIGLGGHDEIGIGLKIENGIPSIVVETDTEGTGKIRTIAGLMDSTRVGAELVDKGLADIIAYRGKALEEEYGSDVFPFFICSICWAMLCSLVQVKERENYFPGRAHLITDPIVRSIMIAMHYLSSSRLGDKYADIIEETSIDEELEKEYLAILEHEELGTRNPLIFNSTIMSCPDELRELYQESMRDTEDKPTIAKNASVSLFRIHHSLYIMDQVEKGNRDDPMLGNHPVVKSFAVLFDRHPEHFEKVKKSMLEQIESLQDIIEDMSALKEKADDMVDGITKHVPQIVSDSDRMEKDRTTIDPVRIERALTKRGLREAFDRIQTDDPIDLVEDWEEEEKEENDEK